MKHSLTRNAAITDLRSLFADVPRFGMPAGEGEEGTENADTLTSDPAPARANDSENEDVAGEAEDEDGDDEQSVRNPRIKALSEESKKHRLAAKQERERADGLQDRVVTLMLENAFIKSAAGRVSDFDAALKLMDRTGISISPEGE